MISYAFFLIWIGIEKGFEIMKTFMPKEADIDRQWFLVDAEGKTVGRIAVEIANILRGKNKPTYAPHVDTGDFVIVINAEKVKFTGNKEDGKIYQTYSGWRGGLKETTAKELRSRHPEDIIKLAVKGMLPHNNLSRKLFKRLKVYAGSEHPHTAQKVTAI